MSTVATTSRDASGYDVHSESEVQASCHSNKLILMAEHEIKPRGEAQS
jgi:hypothetical protein